MSLGKGSWRLLAGLIPALCACDRPAVPVPTAVPRTTQPATTTSALPPDVVATVDGVPVTEADLRLQRQLSSGHQRKPAETSDEDAPAEPEMTPEWRKGVCETLIRRELFAQRAIALGLDADPDYRRKLQDLEARVAEFRREELGKLFTQREIIAKATPTDAELRQYFDANATRIRTVLRVAQILLPSRDEALVERTRKDLEAGVAFDEVAVRRYPDSPPPAPGASKPWEVEVHWFGVPLCWRGAVFDLKDGERSGLLHEGGRTWFVKVLGRRDDPTITFESSKAAIVALLQNDRLQQVIAETEQALRSKATITYRTP